MSIENPTVLVVEDEQAYVEALRIGLVDEGFRVEIARDGHQALELFDETNPDLILLDLMLPRVSGIDVCREIRSRSAVPIIIVSAKSAEVDTVVGLEVGADDYIVKPYRIRELVARIRAVLRRSTVDDGQGLESGVKEIAGLRLDSQRHEVSVDGNLLTLPLREFKLLEFLMANAGRVLERQILINQIWGHDYVGDTKTLDVHIKRLRSKIESDPSNPRRIVTVRGLGYKFEDAITR